VQSGKLDANGVVFPGAQISFSDPAGERNARKLEAAHPEVKAAFERYTGATVAKRYGNLFVRLGFTSDQIEEFERVVPAAIGTLTNMDGKPYAFVGEKKSSDEILQGLQSFLNPDAYQQAVAYTRELTAQELAQKAAAQATAAGSAFSAGQANQLAQLLQDHADFSRNGGGYGTVAWNEVFQQASGFLSPDQLAGLTAVEQQVIYRNAVAAQRTKSRATTSTQ
jgi:hypothetical protein